jgi:hypothetical protein
MNSTVSRRDFLKLAGLLPFSLSIPPIIGSFFDEDQATKQNRLKVS